jgi:hypothetical protein
MAIAATVTLTTLSRRARPYVTGCASLIDDKRRRPKLDEKDTAGPAITTAFAIRGVHRRPRAAQTDGSSLTIGRPGPWLAERPCELRRALNGQAPACGFLKARAGSGQSARRARQGVRALRA